MQTWRSAVLHAMPLSVGQYKLLDVSHVTVVLYNPFNIHILFVFIK